MIRQLGVWGTALCLSTLLGAGAAPPVESQDDAFLDETMPEGMKDQTAENEPRAAYGTTPKAKFPDPKSVAAYDWIKYEWIQCSVKWDTWCRGLFPVAAPENWQVCKPLYRVCVSKNSVRYAVTPGGWFKADPESPDRFRSYTFMVNAAGSGNMFDRWGSTMRLCDVGVRLLPASATNADRVREGCSMPRHD